MPVTASGNQARWDAMNADPARRRQLAAGRQRERAPIEAWLAEGGGLDAQIRQLLADLMPVVRNAAGPARVDLLDEISWWGITAADFAKTLATVPDGDLDLHICSPGGDIFDAIAIMNMLRQRDGQVTVVVDGIAASAASLIAVGAASPGRLFMAAGANLMIHDAHAIAAGNEQDHQDMAALLGRESDSIASIYARRAGQPTARIRDLMKSETWYVGREAVDAGLADAMMPGDEPAWLAIGDTSRSTSADGPGRPGNPAIRQAAYARWSAQTGHGGQPSPYITAWLRP